MFRDLSPNGFNIFGLKLSFTSEIVYLNLLRSRVTKQRFQIEIFTLLVCRLLAVEVENKLTNIARIRKPRENNTPIYYKE